MAGWGDAGRRALIAWALAATVLTATAADTAHADERRRSTAETEVTIVRIDQDEHETVGDESRPLDQTGSPSAVLPLAIASFGGLMAAVVIGRKGNT